MMPRASAGLGCSPAFVAAQMVSALATAFEYICFAATRPTSSWSSSSTATFDTATLRMPRAVRRSPTAVRACLSASSSISARMSVTSTPRPNVIFSTLRSRMSRSRPAMLAEPRASLKSLTTTSSSRNPTITVGEPSSIGVSTPSRPSAVLCTRGWVGA